MEVVFVYVCVGITLCMRKKELLTSSPVTVARP